MGRPACCDKMGVKKGPWTPKEDIMLVSYVQEHGPGNWRAVPIITGLRRCSKSCRLRWANYLRLGIKRGNFTNHEEKMIIQLQALLGNKWAAIASYLPERTDNDIKNYWNIHLKKKLKKLQSPPEIHNRFSSSSHSISRGQWERRLQADINTAKQALEDALSQQNTIQILELKPDLVPELKPQGFTFASSIENIARLLKDWLPNTLKSEQSISSNSINNLTSFESSSNSGFSRSGSPEASFVQGESKPDPIALVPLSMLENWLLDESVIPGKEYLTDLLFD